MSKDDLYTFFGCSSKEELYDKLKSRDEKVRSLHDFIEFSKGDLEGAKEFIGSPEDAGTLFVQYDMPEEEECKLVFVNTKNKPVHFGSFNVRDDVGFRTVLKEGLNAGGVGTLLLHNRASSHEEEDMYNDVREYLRVVGLEALDSFRYEASDGKFEDRLYSYRENGRYSLNFLKERSGNDGGAVYSVEEKREYGDMRGFEEFSSYYAKKEIVGLNMFDEFDDIQDALKVGYQLDQQEVMGLITCDSDGYVLSLKEMFKGSANASIADPSVYAREVLNEEQVTYASVFHNHPSGNPEPSREDLSVTKRFDKASERLAVQLLDHLIIGKEYVYSLAVDSSKQGIDSPLKSNERYKESVNAIREYNKSYGKQLTLNSFVKDAGVER